MGINHNFEQVFCLNLLWKCLIVLDSFKVFDNKFQKMGPLVRIA